MVFNIISQILGFIGSLCLLLFGMNMLSDGIQKGAGSGLQKLLFKITSNRFKAVLTGLGITAIIQSSGATTVMVVSFVNAEIITLQQAIGVIFGANIGTTVTAWIVSLFGFNFDIVSLSIPLFGFGFILKLFKKFKIHNFADCFMGFALLFFGLGLLKDSLDLNDSVKSLFAAISNMGLGGILLGVLIGAIITALIHSSSAMTAIVLTMAANNSLSWSLSAAIVLGSNIGSTIDAVMSSFNASTNARRAALVHVGFNVSGTLLALIFFRPFLGLIDLIVPGTPASNITTHISMLHTVFNTLATILFLPFINQIALLSTKIIKDSQKEEDLHYKFPAILPGSRISADLYSIQVQTEISKMAAKVMDMIDSIFSTLNSPETATEINQKVHDLENYIDEMNDSITSVLQKFSRLPNANSDDRKNFSRMIRITDSLESLSDECCSMMHTLEKYVTSKDYEKNTKRKKEISEYLDLLRVFFEQVTLYFTLGLNPEERKNGQELENKIDNIQKDLKKESKKRLENGADVKQELQYMDLIKKIERSGDCIYTILQTL